jgi:3-hydroxyisobutyrate dehydrogenase
MVGDPADVEECYLGKAGVLTSLRPGGLAIDMTTSSPLLAAQIAEAGKGRGIDCLDAPVSGGDVGARNATLSIMVGGSREACERARPLLGKLGRNIVWQGEAGAGQHTKMCNQIANAGNMLGLAESLAYAKAAGLDCRRVLESISSGAAGSWALSNLAPRVLDGDFAPGFFVKHFIKDMRIAVESAQAMAVDLPGLALALRLYEQVAAAGGEDYGTQALARLYFDGVAGG